MLEKVLVENVAFDQNTATSLKEISKELSPPRRDIVDNDNLGPFGLQTVGQIAPDKAGTTSDADLRHDALQRQSGGQRIPMEHLDSL